MTYKIEKFRREQLGIQALRIRRVEGKTLVLELPPPFQKGRLGLLPIVPYCFDAEHHKAGAYVDVILRYTARTGEAPTAYALMYKGVTPPIFIPDNAELEELEEQLWGGE